MAQYGGEQEQYKKEEGYAHNQLHSTTTGHEIGGAGTNIHSATTSHDIGGTGTNVHSTTEGYNVGGTGTNIRTGGYEEGKHGGAGGGYSTGLGVVVLARLRMMEREAEGRRKVWLRRSSRSYLAAIMAAMSTRLQPLPPL
ncbi:uncharacterized protein LOC110907133 [Helianthus annuus]|uniref:uncharacterized protein LOC110907133 n=1 Tax=Helianthus annuus TaxID=4232 RepID=UPI001652F3CC|nr:uncharacterized protein LOC110907133 [Helianthus annuus]